MEFLKKCYEMLSSLLCKAGMAAFASDCDHASAPGQTKTGLTAGAAEILVLLAIFEPVDGLTPAGFEPFPKGDKPPFLLLPLGQIAAEHAENAEKVAGISANS